jgi:predicted CoA-binding protein
MQGEEKTAGVDFKQLFQEISTIAVVGYSDKPERAGHYVAHYLKDAGYDVLAINPKFGDEVNGLPNYKSLADIPNDRKIDLVDVFRSPPVVPEIAQEAAKLDPVPKYFFMQPGAESPEGAKVAAENGMIPIMYSCMMAAHKIWK